MGPALSAEGTSWKVTLPCTLEEAREMGREDTAFAEMDPPPVLMTSEADPDRPDEWRLEAYFESKPDPARLDLLKRLAPSSGPSAPLIERIEEQDWVTLSQQGLEPIRAGRFYVHTPAHRKKVPADAVAIEIDAGRAF